MAEKKKDFGTYLRELPWWLKLGAYIFAALIIGFPFVPKINWVLYNSVDMTVKGLGFLLAGYGWVLSD